MNPGFDTSRGLSAGEAARRLAAFGPNELARTRSRNLWMIIRGVLREPMFLLLLLGAGVYLVIGDLGEGLFLSAGAALSLGLVIIQEARSEGALRALRDLAEPRAHVVRDGQTIERPARELVPGDLIVVREGERLPADARLEGLDLLSVDESMLTGESVPVMKRGPDAGTPGDERLFAGTMIVGGSAAAVVTGTGQSTALGAIGASLSQAAAEPTPLQKTARRLLGWLALAAISFCMVVFLAYGFLRDDWLDGALVAITAAIAMLPEEFPMVLAVFLAIGAWRLARHNVLVRRSAVIEAIGGATLLCVDKTGTLTRNRMKLTHAWVGGADHVLDDGGALDPEADALLQVAALASSRLSSDPMDRAVLEVASASRNEAAATLQRSWDVTPARLAMIQQWRGKNGEFAAAKGAPEAIFRMSRLPEEKIAALRAVIEEMAAKGLRVLGVASTQPSASFPDDPERVDFAFRGLIGFIDPLRDDVPQAIQEALSAGIDVVMITGDHPATALEIARRAGIDVEAGVVSGSDLDQLDNEGVRERVRRAHVFARITPQQKLRLVEAFKKRGEFVVMTGDGVNDGPALQAADIGIAMGRRGTDVAREAADIVLLDDSFASIVGGVRLGRRIFANLRKALIFITAVHVPMAGLALTPVLLGWPPLFLPMHIVLLELVIDPVCSLVFEAEPSERRAMKRPPRPRDEPLFGPGHVALAMVQGAVVFAGIAAFYAWALAGGPEPQARGAAFVSLVIANLTLALSDAAGGRGGLFDRSRTAFWVIVLVAAASLVVVFYVPAFRDIFKVEPPRTEVLLAGIVTALVTGGWFGLVKIVRSRRSNYRAV